MPMITPSRWRAGCSTESLGLLPFLSLSRSETTCRTPCTEVIEIDPHQVRGRDTVTVCPLAQPGRRFMRLKGRKCLCNGFARVFRPSRLKNVGGRPSLRKILCTSVKSRRVFSLFVRRKASCHKAASGPKFNVESVRL